MLRIKYILVGVLYGGVADCDFIGVEAGDSWGGVFEYGMSDVAGAGRVEYDAAPGLVGGVGFVGYECDWFLFGAVYIQAAID